MAQVEEVFAKFLNISVEELTVCRNGGNDVEACRNEWIPKDFDCLRSLMDTFKSSCGGRIPDHGHNFIKYLVRECEQPTRPHAESILSLQNACKQVE